MAAVARGGRKAKPAAAPDLFAEQKAIWDAEEATAAAATQAAAEAAAKAAVLQLRAADDAAREARADAAEAAMQAEHEAAAARVAAAAAAAAAAREARQQVVKPPAAPLPVVVYEGVLFHVVIDHADRMRRHVRIDWPGSDLHGHVFLEVAAERLVDRTERDGTLSNPPEPYISIVALREPPSGAARS